MSEEEIVASETTKTVTLTGVRNLISLVAFISVITFVISLGLVVQIQDRNKSLERLEEAVDKIEVSAGKTEVSTADVEAFVDQIREDQKNNEGVGTEELRAVFAIIQDIKAVVCTMNAEAPACT